MTFLPIYSDAMFNPKTFSVDDMKNISSDILSLLYVEWDNDDAAAKIKIFYPFEKVKEKDFEENINYLAQGIAQTTGKNLKGNIYGFYYDGQDWEPQIYEFKKRWAWERKADKKIFIGDLNFVHNFMEGFLTMKLENI